jgi:acyl-CoA reductase-like NAD-dependent aldehyde dehydrogenase
LRLGPAKDPATQLNPVITSAQAAHLRTVATRAAAEVQATGGQVVVAATGSDALADLVRPAVFLLRDGIDPADVPSVQEELFGPIVHVIPYSTLEQAVQFANGVPYALTAGILAQSGEDVEFLARRLDAGSVYINRPITAARVGVEPFGGFKRSGTGPKAGSAEYLLAFVNVAPGDQLTTAAMLENLRCLGARALAPRPTVDIPGQLNRLVYDRALGHGLVLLDTPAYFRSAVIVAALTAGNEVTAVAQSPEEAQALRVLAAEVRLPAGVAPRFHVAVGTDTQALASVCAFDFVAGSTNALRAAAQAYAKQPQRDQLPAFIGTETGAPPDLPGEFIRRFVRPRLIAENTLRHGALISTGGLWG